MLYLVKDTRLIYFSWNYIDIKISSWHITQTQKLMIWNFWGTNQVNNFLFPELFQLLLKKTMRQRTSWFKLSIFFSSLSVSVPVIVKFKSWKLFSKSNSKIGALWGRTRLSVKLFWRSIRAEALTQIVDSEPNIYSPASYGKVGLGLHDRWGNNAQWGSCLLAEEIEIPCTY